MYIVDSDGPGILRPMTQIVAIHMLRDCFSMYIVDSNGPASQCSIDSHLSGPLYSAGAVRELSLGLGRH